MNDNWYDDNGGWHTVPVPTMDMARHLHREHGLSVRQINRRLGITDLEVRHALDGA